MDERSNESLSTELDSQIQAWATEYASVRVEINEEINRQHHTIVYTLAAASVAIPLVSGLFDKSANLPSYLIPSVFYMMTIFIAVVMMVFATSMYMIAVSAKYLHEYIEPEVNQLIKTQRRRRLLGWESFLRKNRRRRSEIFLASIGLGMLIIVSLVSGLALLLTASHLASQLTPEIWGLGIIAWLLYGIAVVSIGLSFLYTMGILKNRDD